MYVRDAKNRDEVWLLEMLDEMGLDDPSFRSRDYVIAVDEASDERAGFGRIRVHKTDEGEYCELTCVGTPEEWRGQGVGAHVVERLAKIARDKGFDRVYTFTDRPGYLTQFGFEPIESSALPDALRERLARTRERVGDDAVATTLETDGFSMPERLREAFKVAEPADDSTPEPETTAEDFGIDPETATYKYDTGRRTR
jgi:N-acetylglutamate synthase-like GNAT family acetyltransferase